MAKTLKHGDTYCGFRITHKPGHPVTGQWRAERYGVGMCAGTAEALRRMIDTKTYIARMPA